jgi:mevalonate kinase
VVQWVETRRAAYPAVYEQIFQGMDAATQQTANLLDSAGRPQCADLFNIQQGFMDALGVNTPELEGIIRSLRKTPDITAAKISGSGLGDCALGIGTVNTWNGPGKWIPVQLSRQGVT